MADVLSRNNTILDYYAGLVQWPPFQGHPVASIQSLSRDLTITRHSRTDGLDTDRYRSRLYMEAEGSHLGILVQSRLVLLMVYVCNRYVSKPACSRSFRQAYLSFTSFGAAAAQELYI